MSLWSQLVGYHGHCSCTAWVTDSDRFILIAIIKIFSQKLAMREESNFDVQVSSTRHTGAFPLRFFHHDLVNAYRNLTNVAIRLSPRTEHSNGKAVLLMVGPRPPCWAIPGALRLTSTPPLLSFLSQAHYDSTIHLLSHLPLTGALRLHRGIHRCLRLRPVCGRRPRSGTRHSGSRPRSPHRGHRSSQRRRGDAHAGGARLLLPARGERRCID